MGKSGDVMLAWIYRPGHAGVEGNEAAGRVAHNTVASGMIPVDRTGTSKSVVDKLVQEKKRPMR